MLPSQAEDLIKIWKQQCQERNISPLLAATGYKWSSAKKLNVAKSALEVKISQGKLDTRHELLMISSSDLIVLVRFMSRSRRGVKPYICCGKSTNKL